MQREPFGDILTETLQHHWERQYNDSFQLHWHWKPKSLPALQSIDFICNIYLNAVFPVGTTNGALEPIRREFSCSTVPWRTPLQSAYCWLALSPKYARWFKQATLRVTPSHSALSDLVIIPGNNKLRVLDRQKDVVHGVLKQGFPLRRIQNEIAARQKAHLLGIPIPDLMQCDADAGWFSESYVVGTPLNRITDLQIVSNVSQKAVQRLNTLWEATSESTTVGDYLEVIESRVTSHIERNHLLDEDLTRAIVSGIKRLSNALAPVHRNALLTSQTHGDFQPANILVGDHQFWIIDWEYANRRQFEYDLLVFDIQSRQGRGLANRLQKFVERGFLNDAFKAPFSNDQTARHTKATVLLLEELELRLAENTNPRFTKLDSGLSILLSEIALWISAQ